MATRARTEHPPRMKLPEEMKNVADPTSEPVTNANPRRSTSHDSPRQRARSSAYTRSSLSQRPRQHSSGDSAAEQPRKAPAHDWVISHHRGNLITKHRKSRLGHGGVLAAAARQRLRAAAKSPPSSESAPDDNIPVSEKTADLREGVVERLEVSFAELQRMRLRKLQAVLVSNVADMYLGQGEPDGWETALQQYIQAFRDYEYMTQALSTGTEDPFIAHTEDEAVHWMLYQIHQTNEETWHRETRISSEDWQRICKRQDALFLQASPGGTGAPPIGGTRRAKVRESRLRSIQGRILTAIVGGLFLIGPMWLMVLHNTRYTALVSTSVCVFAFGVLMASTLEKPMEVLSSTAAYAAVLMVFVGANTQPEY